MDSFKWMTVAVVCAALAWSSATRAQTFTLNPYTGASSQVQIIVTQVGTDVQFAVNVIPNPNIGDIRGVFFNISDESLLPGLSITGADVTQVVKSANSVTNLGGGNNTNPEGPFDIGVEIGTPGIGSDDIQSTVFTASHSSGLLTTHFTTVTDPVTGSGPNALLFAVRLTSVGLPGSNRGGSSKLGVTGGDGGGPPQEVVPEPGTMAFLGAMGLAGMALIRRRCVIGC